MEQPVARVARPDLMRGRRPGDFMEVMLADMFHPGRFFVQINDCGAGEVDDLLDDMQDFYNKTCNSPTLRLSRPELVVDLHCAVGLPEDCKWYRAALTAVQGDMVEAVLLDFGRVAVVSVSKHVRRLMPQFTSPLPAQAVAARLGRVAPPCAGPWPEESAELLQELARGACNFRGEAHAAGLVARLEGWAKDGVAVLRLYDTVTNSLPDGVELGQRLLEEGLARPDTEQLLALPPGAGVWGRLEELLQEQAELLGVAGPQAVTAEQRAVLARLQELAGEGRRLLVALVLPMGGEGTPQESSTEPPHQVL